MIGYKRFRPETPTMLSRLTSLAAPPGGSALALPISAVGCIAHRKGRPAVKQRVAELVPIEAEAARGQRSPHSAAHDGAAGLLSKTSEFVSAGLPCSGRMLIMAALLAGTTRHRNGKTLSKDLEPA